MHKRNLSKDLSGMRVLQTARKGFFSKILGALSTVWMEKQARLTVTVTIVAALTSFIIFQNVILIHSLGLVAMCNYMFSQVLRMSCFLVQTWVTRAEKTRNQHSVYSFGYQKVSILGNFTASLVVILYSVFGLKQGLEFMLQRDRHIRSSAPVWAFICLLQYGLVQWHISKIPIRDFFGGLFIQNSRKRVDGIYNHLQRNDMRAKLGIAAVAIVTSIALLAVTNNSALTLFDLYGGFAMILMTFLGNTPVLLQNAMLLLQAAPAEITTRLEKSLREVSTFEGVLEFHKEHFWALSPDEMAGSLHVRVRRDADEQAVLAQVTNKLANLIPARNLTVQIIKDDWIISATPRRL
eukprot:m.134002 g.134002  ORF g.134002 m.134002 type:complete len:351 (+) comp14683_c0_seq4:279-1331(+)